RLVSRLRLVQKLLGIAVKPCLARHLFAEFVRRERLARLVAPHDAPGPVWAGRISLVVTAPAHYVRRRAHAARDNAHPALARVDRALACYPRAVVEALGVVVVTIDALDLVPVAPELLGE